MMSEPNTIQRRIDEASERLGKILVLDDFTLLEIPSVVFHAMEISSEFMELKGATKKRVILSALKSVVSGIYKPKFAKLNSEDSKESEVELGRLQKQMDLANNMIETLVPGLIDTLAWVTKQKINFNPKKFGSSCLSVCLPAVVTHRV
jgi:hypothetical protein